MTHASHWLLFCIFSSSTIIIIVCMYVSIYFLNLFSLYLSLTLAVTMYFSHSGGRSIQVFTIKVKIPILQCKKYSNTSLMI